VFICLDVRVSVLAGECRVAQARRLSSAAALQRGDCTSLARNRHRLKHRALARMKDIPRSERLDFGPRSGGPIAVIQENLVDPRATITAAQGKELHRRYKCTVRTRGRTRRSGTHNLASDKCIRTLFWVAKMGGATVYCLVSIVALPVFPTRPNNVCVNLFVA
jgi:hypothetical protein